MTTLAVIGSGSMGGTVARLAAVAGCDVILTNSRGPETLAALAAELGPRASAAHPHEAAAAADIALVSVPLAAYANLPVDQLVRKTVMDTNNYYPDRDGTIASLEDGSLDISRMLQELMPEAKVVRAFNNISATPLAALARPRDAEGRSSLPIAGDDNAALQEVAGFLDDIGYNPLTLHPLDEAKRFNRYTDAYVQPYIADGDHYRPRPVTAETLRRLLHLD